MSVETLSSCPIHLRYCLTTRRRFDKPTVLKAMFAYKKNFAARKIPLTLE